jgi:hypothetical protein
MEYVKDTILIEELEKWLSNKKINPKTNKRIYKSSKIYKFYNSLNLLELYAKNCINDIDPISLNYLWEIKNGEKIIVHNLNDIIFYKDNRNNIKFFEKESIIYMKGYNINYDPVTKEELPTHIFDAINGKKIIEDSIKTIKELALEVFQLFSNISIFIDYDLFLNLDITNLRKLNYEISEFFKHNFSIEQQNQISRNVLKKNINDITKDELQKYLLEQFKILLECPIEDYKYMINYILVGGLSLVIPQVKESYPDYSFDFTI